MPPGMAKSVTTGAPQAAEIDVLPRPPVAMANIAQATSTVRRFRLTLWAERKVALGILLALPGEPVRRTLVACDGHWRAWRAGE